MKIIIVDTDSYSGNFERELCAFLTGQLGEAELAQGFISEPKPITFKDWWSENTIHLKDEDDMVSPFKIWETPGWFNNGLGKNYRDTPENEIIAVQEAVKFMKNYVAGRMQEAQQRLESKNFDAHPTGFTEENCHTVIESCLNDIERVSVLTKFSSYQSIAIFVKDYPPENVWAEFEERAKYFAGNLDKILPYATSPTMEILSLRQEEIES